MNATTLSTLGKTIRLGAMFPAAGAYVNEGVQEGNWFKIVGGAVLAAIAFAWSMRHDKALSNGGK